MSIINILIAASSGGPGDLELTYFGVSENSAAAAITPPTGYRYGDLAFYVDYARNTSGVPSAVTPSGFSSITTVTNADARLSVSRKLLTGSEGSITGMAVATSANRKALLIYRPNKVIATLANGSVLSQATNGSPSDQTISGSGQLSPLIAFATGASTTTGFTATLSGVTGDVTFGGANRLRGEVKVYNTAPIDVTAQMTDGGENLFISFYVTAQ